MKTILSLVFFLFAGLCGFAQSKAVYAELGGPGFMSVNYDMRFSQNEDGFGGRIGVGGFALSDGDGSKVSLLTVPVGVNYLLGKDGKNYFELGAGYTYMNVGSKFEDENSTFRSSFGNLTFGYRLAPRDGGFIFKAQITPIFNQYGFIPYFGGVGFGYKF